MKNKFVNLNLYSFLFEALKIAGGENLVDQIYNYGTEKQIAYYPDDKSIGDIVSGNIRTKFFNLAAGEVVNLDSPDVLNGSVLLEHLNFEGNEKIPENVASQFDYKNRKFKDEFLANHKEYLRNKQITIAVNFILDDQPVTSGNRTGASMSNLVYKGVGGGSSVAKMNLHLMQDLEFQDSVDKQTLRHELTHFTQVINSLCLLYVKKLKNPTEKDIGSIKLISQVKSKLYGVGSETTGLTQNAENPKNPAAHHIKIDKYASGKGNIEKIKGIRQDINDVTPFTISYLGSDEEYETQKNDLVQKIIEIINQNIPTRSFSLLFNNKPVDLKNNREFGSWPNVSSRQITSLNDLIVLTIKDIVQNPRLIISHENFIKIMLRLKPKEFLRDLTNDLRNGLNTSLNRSGESMTQSRNTRKTKQLDPSSEQRRIKQEQDSLKKLQRKTQQASNTEQPNQSMWNRIKNYIQNLKQTYGAYSQMTPAQVRDLQGKVKRGEITPQELTQIAKAYNTWDQLTPNTTNPTVQTESTKISEILYDKK